jgi:hypothetical protein
MAMSDEEMWTVYVRLWGRCEGRDLFVRYVGPEDVRDGEAGYFHPRDDPRFSGSPEIAIMRRDFDHDKPSAPTSRRRDASSVDRGGLFEELCTLAHEFGHSRSWRDGQRTEVYAEAVIAFDKSATLSDVQRKAIMDEEERAWNFGRLELDFLGFSEWAGFRANQDRALRIYGEMLERLR